MEAKVGKRRAKEGALLKEGKLAAMSGGACAPPGRPQKPSMIIS